MNYANNDHKDYWYKAYQEINQKYSVLEQHAHDTRDVLERALIALKLSTPKYDQLELKMRHDAAIIRVEHALKKLIP